MAVPWANIGLAIADAITFGLASKLPAIGSGISSWWSAHAPTWAGGAAPKPVLPAKQPIAGHRRYGGPVVAGRRYIVGEAGQEEFVPGRSGTIVPHSELQRRREVRAAPGIAIHIHGANDPHAVAREVERVLKKHASGQAAVYAD